MFDVRDLDRGIKRDFRYTLDPRKLKLPSLTQDKRKFRLVLCFFFVWVTWISGVFGNAGVLQAYRLSSVRYELSQRVRALENDRDRMRAQLEGLNSDRFSQEKAIRDVLGFVRDSELVFEFR